MSNLDFKGMIEANYNVLSNLEANIQAFFKSFQDIDTKIVEKETAFINVKQELKEFMQEYKKILETTREEFKTELVKEQKQFIEIANANTKEVLNARKEELTEIMEQEEQKVLLKAEKVITILESFQDNINSKMKDILKSFPSNLENTTQDYINNIILDVKKIGSTLKNDVEEFEINLLLDGEYDMNNAIVTIHSGAGGTEACDWADMLYRMYLRWCNLKGYKVSELDFMEGDSVGVKSVTFLVEGINAYGYLKSEKGVHRLVRISPFDANKKRHTSFASVEVVPEVDENVEVEINPADIRIDTYRASGAGGQHVNMTDSAVRITHFPSGIVVTCQKERSQLSNRETAMKMLKSKLLELELKKKEEEMKKIQGEQSDIGWGNQIRSYVFQPYALVKDHRTNTEIGNVKAVMDGSIDDFINSYLRWIKNN